MEVHVDTLCYSLPRSSITQQPSQMLALLLIATLLLVWTPSQTHAASIPVNLNVITCFVFPNPVNDLGFTYNFNIARLKVLRRLQLDYPNVAISTPLFFNALASSNLTQAYISFVASSSCDLVFSTSTMIAFGIPRYSMRMPQLFPTVRIVNYDIRQVFGNASLLQPNIRGMSMSVSAGWFAAGAAAAAQCQRCVGFIFPFHNSATTVNAFARGMRWARQYGYALGNSTTCPLYAITHNSFLDVPAETTMTQLFLRKGCDVIGYWTDDQTVSRVVRDSGLTDTFSVSYNVDAARFWGDSVLTSVLIDQYEVLYNFTEDVILNNTLVPHYADGTTGCRVGAVSPRASRDAVIALNAAWNAQVSRYDVFCGGFTTLNGSQLYSGCWSDWQLAYRTELDFLVQTLPDFNRSSVCPPGTEPEYSVLDFTLTCLPCAPMNKYSPGFGAMCKSCDASLNCKPNGTASGCLCFEIVIKDTSLRDTILLAVTIPIGVGLLVAAMWTIWRIVDARAKKTVTPALHNQSVAPPMGPTVTFVLLGVDNRMSEKDWRQNLDTSCDVFDVLSDHVLNACRAYKAYIVYTSADIWLLSTSSEIDATLLAWMILNGFRAGPFGRRIALKIAIHSGCADTTTSADDSQENAEAKKSDGESASTSSGTTVKVVVVNPPRSFAGGDADLSRYGLNSTSTSNNNNNSSKPSQIDSHHRNVVYVGQTRKLIVTMFSKWTFLRGYSIGLLVQEHITSRTDRSMSSMTSQAAAMRWKHISEAISKLSSTEIIPRILPWSEALLTDTMMMSPVSSNSSPQDPGRGDKKFYSVILLPDHHIQEVNAVTTTRLQTTASSSSSPTATIPNHKDETSSSGSKEFIENYASLRFSLLTVGEVHTLFTICHTLIRSFVRVLPQQQRKQTVRDATRLTRANLEFRDARESRSDDKGNLHLVFKEQYLIRQLTIELLTMMDEKLLEEWIRCGGSLTDGGGM